MNDSNPLNRASDRSIFVQRPVRSDAVVVTSIVAQHSAQMRLAQHDEMVHTLAPDRSDQPFGKAILPRRGWCSRLVPDTHGTQSACREHGNALIGALRKTYGPDFAKGCADHENLKSSLSQLIRDHEAGKLEQIC